MGPRRVAVTAIAAILLLALPQVMAQGEQHDVEGDNHTSQSNNDTHQDAPSYFRHGGHVGWVLGHTVLMIFAWVIAMPLAIMLGLARSHFHLPVQGLFHFINGLAIITGHVYNRATPDLYQGNVHSIMGWIVTSFAIIWTVSSVCLARKDRRTQQSDSAAPERGATYERILQADHDSSRPSSSDEMSGEEDMHREELEKRSSTSSLQAARRGLSHIGHILYSSSIPRFTRNIFITILLPAGFSALVSGFVVYGGVARDRHVYSFLAHSIKGAIFFWYGLLTLARWLGAFTDLGWAWNVKPADPLVATWKARVPSAEFTESFVIWLYGVTNVFLEHVNHWAGAWTAADLEHVSITILFFGGGLLGMTIEISGLFKIIDTTALGTSRRHQDSEYLIPETKHQQAASSAISFNPMPGVVIMILGMMMSSHHQESMVSTMMHAQWGTLLMVFAIARAVTYVLLYLKPPTSHYPSRPPSELAAAYCLSLGGLMFMLSTSDTIAGIEASALDAMVIFTLAAGLNGIVLAWLIVCFAIKSRAIGKEGRSRSWRY